jgi:hypothetical protein
MSAAHIGQTFRFYDLGHILANEGAALLPQNVAIGQVSGDQNLAAVVDVRVLLNQKTMAGVLKLLNIVLVTHEQEFGCSVPI